MKTGSSTGGASGKFHGFTLIELLVVMGVIGLIAALVLPAVQSSREAARRIACANNMRQVCLAVHSYHDAVGRFPLLIGYPDPRSAVQKQFSMFTAILPQIEQNALYHAINFSTHIADPYGGPFYPESLSNETVIGTVLRVLLCPSDPAPAKGPQLTAGTNLRGNMGSDRWHMQFINGKAQGPFEAPAAATTDGLGSTIMVSEKLRSSGDGSHFDPRAGAIIGGLGLPFTLEESLSACRSLKGTPNGFRAAAGLCWFVGMLPEASYNHTLSPNNQEPDCSLPNAWPIAGCYGARSNHPGIVNAGMADGSVREIRNGISPTVWMALGTRAGGEIVSADQD